MILLNHKMDLLSNKLKPLQATVSVSIVADNAKQQEQAYE
jgi:hypothetical protein